LALASSGSPAPPPKGPPPAPGAPSGRQSWGQPGISWGKLRRCSLGRRSATAPIQRLRWIFLRNGTTPASGGLTGSKSCLHGGSGTPMYTGFSWPAGQQLPNGWLQRGCKLDNTLGAGNRGEPVARCFSPPLPHLVPAAKEVAHDLRRWTLRLRARHRASLLNSSSHCPASVRVVAMTCIDTAGRRLEQKFCRGGARRLSRPKSEAARRTVKSSEARYLFCVGGADRP
jgi:hypothetical protein